VLEKIRLLSSLLPIVFFVIFCKKKASKELWVFFIYCNISFVFDLFLSVSPWASEHRYLIWNIFGILEIGFLSYFFYLIINQRLIRLLILLFSLCFIIFSLFYSKSDNDQNDQYNSIMNSVGSVLILILTLCYIMNSMKQTDEPINILNPVFLIVIAILLNVSSTLFLTIISNHLTVNEMEKYWNISNYSNILMNLIFSSAFVLFYYQHKPKPPESKIVDFTSPNDR
jgi:hypothetical protein